MEINQPKKRNERQKKSTKRRFAQVVFECDGFFSCTWKTKTIFFSIMTSTFVCAEKNLYIYQHCFTLCISTIKLTISGHAFKLSQKFKTILFQCKLNQERNKWDINDVTCNWKKDINVQKNWKCVCVSLCKTKWMEKLLTNLCVHRTAQ